jgi:hypothetical protein
MEAQEAQEEQYMLVASSDKITALFNLLLMLQEALLLQAALPETVQPAAQVELQVQV